MAGGGFGGRDSARGGNRFAAGSRLGGQRGPGARGIGGRSSGLAARAIGRADDIALTAEQRTQIEEVHRVRQESSIQRNADRQIAQLELRDLMGADTRDVAAIEAKLRELSDQQVSEQVEALSLDQSVGQILTAEQLVQLEDLGQRGNRGRAGRNTPRGPRRDPQ